MTLYQAKVYTMKIDGADGVEGIHDRSDTSSPMKSRRKHVQDKIDKAVANIMDGLPWNAPRRED